MKQERRSTLFRKTDLSDMETACLDDIGQRDEQQERVCVLEGGEVHLLALADGMGGHEGGALAAQAVVDAASDQFQALGGAVAGDFALAISAASR